MSSLPDINNLGVIHGIREPQHRPELLATTPHAMARVWFVPGQLLPSASAACAPVQLLEVQIIGGGASVAPETGTGFTRVQVAVPAATTLAPGLSLCFRDGTRVTGIGQDNLGLLKQLLEVLR